MSEIVSKIVGIIFLTAIVAIFYINLPREFSFYTVSEFEADLSNVNDIVETSFTYISMYFDIGLLMLLTQALIFCIVGGFIIKSAVFVVNLLGQGGA